MNCFRCSELIYDYLDNDNLDDQTRREIESHLAVCETCRLELAAIEEGARLYCIWGTAVEPRTDFADEVLARLSNPQTASAYRLLLIVGFGLISVLTMVAFFLAPVLYPLLNVIVDLFIKILPLPGIFLAAFPAAQTASLAVLATVLGAMTWAMRHVIDD